MVGDNRLVTENFLRLNFTPKSGITPGTDDLLMMDCDQIKARYNVLVSGISSTGVRLPSQNQLVLINKPTVHGILFTNYPNDAAGEMTVQTNVSSDGGDTITERGICYNKTGSPNINSPKTLQANTTGIITTVITGLPSGSYYFTAYAKNSVGVFYLAHANTLSIR